MKASTMQTPASRAGPPSGDPTEGAQDSADAQFVHAGNIVTVSAFQDAQGVWMARVTVDTGTRQFEMRELSHAWRGWHTRAEAVRDGMEQAHLLLAGDRHLP